MYVICRLLLKLIILKILVSQNREHNLREIEIDKGLSNIICGTISFSNTLCVDTYC